MWHAEDVTVGPTLRRRRLARELNRLREVAGLTIEDAARGAGISMSHLSRVERAHVGVRVPAVKALLGAYGADAETTTQLVDIARDAAQRGWWHRYARAIPDEYATYIGFESDASHIWNFEVISIPGLLQTEEYARAILRGGIARLSDAEIDRRTEVRLRRQTLLHQPDPPSVWIVLDEAAICRRVASAEVMAAQLRRLEQVATLPHVDIQVIPFSVGAHPGTPGSFVVLRFAETGDQDVVYVETMAGALYQESGTDVDTAISAFDRLRAMALGPDDSMMLINQVAKELS
ncbi:MAG: helix-turn-helix transcriptional regulator [Dactylosporangium sp.]|nr:helix-turn-helix transcriptional regulator [Dactylosporangium sp.]NNJ60224.1 helix-turn-helix transcriptional regulator [Dactylosporangium sp.]